jgi:hypothetical protein
VVRSRGSSSSIVERDRRNETPGELGAETVTEQAISKRATNGERVVHAQRTRMA